MGYIQTLKNEANRPGVSAELREAIAERIGNEIEQKEKSKQPSPKPKVCRCGFPPSVFRWVDPKLECYSVVCYNEKCSLRTTYWPNVDDAIRAWNFDPGDPPRGKPEDGKI